MVLDMLTLPMRLSTLGRGLAMVQAVPPMDIFSVDEKSPLTSEPPATIRTYQTNADTN